MPRKVRQLIADLEGADWRDADYLHRLLARHQLTDRFNTWKSGI